MSIWSKPNARTQSNDFYANHIPGASQSVTWRRYVSGSTGIPEAGLYGSAYYTEKSISAYMGQYFPANVRQQQFGGGMIPVGAFIAVTPHPLQKDDELVWNGNTFRVEGEPTRVALTQNYVVEIKRGS